jgi:hypothetical protein
MESVKPDFFIWLGDNPAHNFWEQEAKSHLRSLKEISETMRLKYGQLGQLYPVLGNHEGYPCDEFDVRGNQTQWILDQTLDAWRPWLTPECISRLSYFILAQDTFRRLGCYSQLHPGTTLRVIGLFPLEGDVINSYLWKNSTDVWHIVLSLAKSGSSIGWKDS